MKNAQVIAGLSRHLQKVSDRIDMLAMDADYAEQNNADLSELYKGQLLDEVSCAQALILKITELVVDATGGEEPGVNGDEGGDGSVFAEGDLTAQKGKAAPAEEGEK